MIGTIIKTTGADYSILSESQIYQCHVKGAFRTLGIKSTNPLTVGDEVEFDAASGYIVRLLPRKNYIIRRPANLSKQQHILAANIDAALLVITLRLPDTSTGFIDRFLATAEAYCIPTTLIFNKVDLLSDDDLQYLAAMEYLYQSIGYNTLRTNALTGEGLNQIREYIKGKKVLLSGNSGVGKSTILNQLVPNARSRTGKISDAHGKGMHTTTFSEMYLAPDNTFIIDTPGIKGFGTVDMQPSEVAHYFPEIFKASARCRFNNCTHTHEPGCAVLSDLKEHYIAESRYNSYLSIMGDASESKYRQSDK